MKVDKIRCIIAELLSASMAWSLYEINGIETKDAILAIVSFIILSLFSSICFGVQFADKRNGAVIRVYAGINFIVAFFVNLFFSFFDFSIVAYLILNISFCLIAFLIIYSIYKWSIQ